jgi:hypothetical protein
MILHLRLVLAELGAPAIPSSFALSRVNEVFDDNGKLVDERLILHFFRSHCL